MTDFSACIDDTHGHASDAEREDCALAAVVSRRGFPRPRSGSSPRPPAVPNASALAESPPEALFLEALALEAARIVAPGLDVVPQCTIKAREAGYRVDVALTLRALPSVRLAVEIDGWAFHGGDRARDAADKKRDRAIVRAGWRVVRFTAAEVSRDPKGCAAEAVETLLAIAYWPTGKATA